MKARFELITANAGNKRAESPLGGLIALPIALSSLPLIGSAGSASHSTTGVFFSECIDFFRFLNSAFKYNNLFRTKIENRKPYA